MTFDDIEHAHLKHGLDTVAGAYDPYMNRGELTPNARLTQWKGSSALSEALVEALRGLLVGEMEDIAFPSGNLQVERTGQTTYAGRLYGASGDVLFDFADVSIPEAVTGMVAEGVIGPVRVSQDEPNAVHIESLEGEMKTMEENVVEEWDDPDMDDTAGMENPDEGTVAEHSAAELGELSESERILVQQLMDQHNTSEPPQVDDYPGGGHQIKIFGSDGFYYFYIVTPDGEVVHLATTGKSRRQLGPTMEDLMRKSNRGFANDLHVFKGGPHKYIRREGSPGNYTYVYPGDEGSGGGVSNVSESGSTKNSGGDDGSATKQRVVDALIAGGNNGKESVALANKHIAYVKRVYPDATPKEMANIMRTLGLEGESPKQKDGEITKKSGSDQATRGNFIVSGTGNRHLQCHHPEHAVPVKIVPDVNSFSADHDNGLTSLQKEIISHVMEDLGRVYALVNNHDMTYTVVFGERPGELAAYRLDRNGEMTPLGPVVDEYSVDPLKERTMRQFKSQQITSTRDELSKGLVRNGRVRLTYTQDTVVDTSPVVKSGFFDTSPDTRTPHERTMEASVAQSVRHPWQKKTRV